MNKILLGGSTLCKPRGFSDSSVTTMATNNEQTKCNIHSMKEESENKTKTANGKKRKNVLNYIGLDLENFKPITVM